MNFIFISPNFPENYWKFCRELKNNGVNVLGIGDCPYDNLTNELKGSLNEYYKVSDLENYDEVFRAVAFYTFKYGKIDFIESNNEYWLERDAALRTEFNVQGLKSRDMSKIKFKSKMKRYYKKAGIKTARYCLVRSLAGCKKFIEEVGYPVIVKPDNGVGASCTYKLKNEDELINFYNTKPPVLFIMEEYIDGVVQTYDAIVDGKGNPVFETGNVTVDSCMDTVNSGGNFAFYILNNPYDDVRDAGRRTLKAFGVKNRFVHFEFFRLNSDQYMGKKGEVVALEVNMRPSGGISPDMMNYANSTDIYKIWADVMTYGSSLVSCGEKYYCGFAGRRDGKQFRYSEQEIKDMYAPHIKAVERVPEVLAPIMGNLMFIANFKKKSELDEFYKNVFEA